jgi:hypothetical protein
MIQHSIDLLIGMSYIRDLHKNTPWMDFSIIEAAHLSGPTIIANGVKTLVLPISCIFFFLSKSYESIKISTRVRMVIEYTKVAIETLPRENFCSEQLLNGRCASVSIAWSWTT